MHAGPHGIGVRIGSLIYAESLLLPQLISGIAYNSTPLKAGMTVSNGMCRLENWTITHIRTEPGYYADGRFGIRIENVVVVRETKTPNNFGDKGYLGFEHVTMVIFRTACVEFRLTRLFQCPMQKTLIQLELLTPQQRTWLNAYHAETLEKVAPLLANDERALSWLKRECSPL